MNPGRIKLTGLFAFALLLLCGCQDVPVAHDLSQRQANEIVAVLSKQGISAHASRGTGSRSQFIIEVPSSNYSEAVSILHFENLPRPEEASLNEILAPKGFLPNSREFEKMRLDRAIASELEGLLKANPAINEVRAVVRRTAFEGVGPEPATNVSLVIRKNPGIAIDQASIFALVKNLIPGVSEQSLVLDIQELIPLVSTARKGIVRSVETGEVVSVPMKEFLGWWRVAENDYDRMIWVLLGTVVGFLVVGLFVGFSAGFIGRKVVSIKDNFPPLKGERPNLTLNSPE